MSALEEKLTELIIPHRHDEGGLIRALHKVQKSFSYIPVQADIIAANIFNLSLAEIKGVVSFYSDFSRKPKGKTVLRICVAEACQSVNARSLVHMVENEFSTKLGETNTTQDITLEPVYCLGLCSCAPAAQIGETLVGRATPERIAQILKRQKEAQR